MNWSIILFKTWVSPAVRVAKVVAANEPTDATGANVEPANAVPLRSTRDDISKAAVVDTR